MAAAGEEQGGDNCAARRYIGQLEDQLQKLGMTTTRRSSSPVRRSAEKWRAGPGFFHSVASTNDLRVPMIVHWPETIPAGAVSVSNGRGGFSAEGGIGFAKTPDGRQWNFGPAEIAGPAKQ